MSAAELARLCAVQLIQRLSDAPRLTDEERLALVESYVAGALNRAVSEAGEQRLVYAGGPGAVDVKVTKSTQGVSLEVDVRRPREDGEDYRVAADASALVAAYAYQRASDAIGALGLTPGKEPKA